MGDVPGKGPVLIVGDDDDIAAMLDPHLRADGFVPIRARGGGEAMVRLRRPPPRMVLLDLDLPDCDGIDIARAIRSASTVPIVMLTARDSESDTIIGLEAGADDYITKPFSPRETLARIHAVLRRVPDPARVADVLAVAGITIDAARREVVLGDGTVVRPTAREFDLAWYFADNRGLTLTRGQILSAVWNEDYLGDTRTIDAHVRQLRRKVPGLPLATVWGVGYRMDP